jgi:hypothetical protein
MIADGTTGSDLQQQLLARASDLMFEALLLLDQTQNSHSAALLDNAIALLPQHMMRPIFKSQESSEGYSASRSSIRR